MPSSTPALLRACAILLFAATAMTGCRDTRPDSAPPLADADAAAGRVRFATYNASLFSDDAGGLVARLRGDDAAARKIAATIQHVRPDVLLLNEFDHDDAGEAAALFVARYLAEGQHGQRAIAYPHVYFAPVNTGVPSGLDLDRDGTTGGTGRARGNDAWGYGLHPGQYGMLVLSRFPIDTASVRSFRLLRWSAMPGALGRVSTAPSFSRASIRAVISSRRLRARATSSDDTVAAHSKRPWMAGPKRGRVLPIHSPCAAQASAPCGKRK